MDSFCSFCHGANAVAAGMAPDLRASQIPLNQQTFASVVRDGAFISRAMPAHPELTDQELEAIRHYIRQQAISAER